MKSVTCALRINALLGESPVWSGREGALYWVDIKKPALHRFNPATGRDEAWPMPCDIGCVGLRDERSVVIALRSGFAMFDTVAGQLEPIHDPIGGAAGIRFNDGRCDRAGRFWAGTQHDLHEPGLGVLYRLDPDRSCRAMISQISVTNGICFAPDDRTFYYSDSRAREIYACDLDVTSGSLANRRVLARFSEGEGVPDGATVDREGFIWVAGFRGGCLYRLDPEGRRDRTIVLPVSRPTSCAFGGPALDLLYVTSASVGLDEKERKSQPLAGSILALDVGVTGLPEPTYKG